MNLLEGQILARRGRPEITPEKPVEQVQAVCLFVPGDPVPKARPRVGLGKRFYTPKGTSRYEASIAWEARQAMRGRPPLTCPLSVEIEVHLPAPKHWSIRKRKDALAGLLLPAVRPDLDNYVKALLDGLNGIAFVDDGQITELRARKRYSDLPGARITLATDKRGA